MQNQKNSCGAENIQKHEERNSSASGPHLNIKFYNEYVFQLEIIFVISVTAVQAIILCFSRHFKIFVSI